MKHIIFQKLNKKINEASGFWGWIKLVVFAVIVTWILMSFNLIFDFENLAPFLVAPFLWIAVGAPSSYICYILARRKKRTGALWIIFGFLFNIFAITAIFVMSESPDEVWQ